MFSNLSSSSISLATVTPSLVMRGAPKLLSRTTLRPFGPSVTFTALARISTPRSMRSRASTENLTSLAAIDVHSVSVSVTPRCRRLRREPRRVIVQGSWAGSGGLLFGRRFLDHAHDVAFLHDEDLDAVELHLGARPLAEQHAVADLQVERDELSAFVAAAGADGGDFALRGLFLGGVRNDD